MNSLRDLIQLMEQDDAIEEGLLRRLAAKLTGQLHKGLSAIEKAHAERKAHLQREFDKIQKERQSRGGQTRHQPRSPTSKPKTGQKRRKPRGGPLTWAASVMGKRRQGVRVANQQLAKAGAAMQKASVVSRLKRKGMRR